MKAQHFPQLPLQFNQQAAFTFDNFVPGENAQIVRLLETQLSGEGERFIYLWGRAGAGCSHLLQAACHRASRRHSAIYLPMEEISRFEPGILEGVEGFDLVCVDHLEVIAGQPDWEEALFHLYNRMLASAGALLLAASQPPRGLGLALPDLVSRLAACPVFQVALLADADKVLLLQEKAAERGIDLSREAAQYILKRSQRSIEALLEILDNLDQSSLSAGRRLTIPFIKQSMNW